MLYFGFAPEFYRSFRMYLNFDIDYFLSVFSGLFVKSLNYPKGRCFQLRFLDAIIASFVFALILF